MSGARWKYKTATVSVDNNTVTVRGLTAGEREKFVEQQRAAKAAKEGGVALPNPLAVTKLVALCGVIDPVLSDDELNSMPGDLLDAAVTKILELSGIKGDDGDEKKGEPQVH